jgi:hypothetical protein
VKLMAANDPPGMHAIDRAVKLMAANDPPVTRTSASMAGLFTSINTATLHTTLPRSAEIASAILRSDELADAVASAWSEERADAVGGVAHAEAEVDPAAARHGRLEAELQADALKDADPLGLMTPERDLTQGEWTLLSVIVGAVALIALNSYHQTAEETGAISLIAFFLVRAILSNQRSPWA